MVSNKIRTSVSAGEEASKECAVAACQEQLGADQ